MANRDTIKGYFYTGAKPSQSNFEALIDSTLNQESDGIKKLSAGPIALQAYIEPQTDASKSTQEILHFYKTFSDSAAWKLNLNPKNTAENSFYPGLNISTEGGKSVLFLSSNGNIGIGTISPDAKLQVSGGAIMPSLGNDKNSGIYFPENPAGGTGDAAWIRYYDSGDGREGTSLELGTSNDPNDHIILNPAGLVRITGSTSLSREAKLHVSGGNAIFDGTVGIGVDVNAPMGVAAKLQVTGGDAIFDNNVGVGTATPGEKLHVNGNVKANFFLGDGSRLSGITTTGALNAALNSYMNLTSDQNNVGGIKTFTGGLKISSSSDANFTNFPLAFTNTALGNKICLWRAGTNKNHYGFGIISNGLTVYTDTPNADVLFGYTADQTGAFNETMRIKGNGNIGIGTNNPVAKLQVSGGAIMPSVGNDKNSGLYFPEDPAGGSGDAAWIRYYVRDNANEGTTLEIGTSNDANDHIILNPAGNVGIGTTSPAEKFDVNGTVKATKFQDSKGEIMPVGTIVLWSGDQRKIPAGWAICNGQDNTPDLRDRFVMGGGGRKQVNEKGGGGDNGDNKIKIRMPDHVHELNDLYRQGDKSDGGGNEHLSVSTQGTDKFKTTSLPKILKEYETDITPLYYVLCYIMKL